VSSLNDWGQVGVIAAELIDSLADSYADEEIEIGVVAVVVEITGGKLDEENWTAINYRCNNPKRWIQRALFEEAKDVARNSSEERDASED
jgi:hypothetical protein